MGAGLSTANKEGETTAGATAPVRPDDEKAAPPPLVGGRRKSRKTRKSRKGKRHSHR
jgi:hypothetical protein